MAPTNVSSRVFAVISVGEGFFPLPFVNSNAVESFKNRFTIRWWKRLMTKFVCRRSAAYQFFFGSVSWGSRPRLIIFRRSAAPDNEGRCEYRLVSP